MTMRITIAVNEKLSPKDFRFDEGSFGVFEHTTVREIFSKGRYANVTTTAADLELMQRRFGKRVIFSGDADAFPYASAL